MLLIDPKRVELAAFAGLPHLLAWPATTTVQAVDTLDWAVKEMDCRYQAMQAAGLRHMADDWPRIVIVIDELALLLLDKKHGRAIDQRLAALTTVGRACGIHLVLATQTPRADVLTGLIRANTPTRIAFATVTQMDSRIILDQPGAEVLRHPGHLLARLPGRTDLVRGMGIYLEHDVVKAIVDAASKKGSTIQ